MPRKCKCYITGEVGTTDTFVKIGSHYYKNQYVYDEDKRLKEERKQLIDYICRTFLGYGEGQPFPSSLPKKLNELSYYDNAVIMETFRQNKGDILFWLDKKDFSSEYGKIAYIFAIIGNKIADVNKKYVREKKITEEQQKKVADFELAYEERMLSIGTKRKAKDISDFLEEEWI